MGAVCGTICGPGKKQIGEDGDIPKLGSVTLNNMEKFKRWSYDFPFYRIHTDVLHEKLNTIGKLDFTFQELS